MNAPRLPRRPEDSLLDRLGLWLAERLRTQTSGYEPYTRSDPETLARHLRPGDVLLVEGNQYVSSVIKYLTQSTWSHSAIYVGPIPNTGGASEPHMLIEVNLGEGCVSAPLSAYTSYNTRICRPIGLDEREREAVSRYMIERLGLRYDLRNIFDLLRYLFPVPLPARWRRRAIALGSGDPTRAICSTLIAQAFQSIRYPILPRVELGQPMSRARRREIYFIRHHSLFAPRDFDLSPYFAVVKPTIEGGFDHRGIEWGNAEEQAAREVA